MVLRAQVSRVIRRARRRKDELPRDLRRHVDRATTSLLSSVIDSVPVDVGGGSGLPKARTFAALVHKYALRTYLEIGVYRGRSLLPVAALFKQLGDGVATGVDPYSFEAAEQHDTELFPESAAKVVSGWNRGMDWDALYAEVLARIRDFGVADHCRIIRASSAEAAASVPAGSIDLLHIDGNHDRAAVLFDVETYLPKVRAGGFVVLDDAWWPSVQDARQVVASRCKEVHADHKSDFVVFRVPGR
jgi:predicted O-methyltransferase YrrM